MNNSNSSNKNNKRNFVTNPIETLKNATNAVRDAREVQELGDAMLQSLRQDLVHGMKGDVMKQVFDREINFSGQIKAGESLNVSSETDPEKIRMKKQLHFEKSLMRSEEQMMLRRQNELRSELQQIAAEIVRTVQQTSELAEEVKIAAMKAETLGGTSTYDKFFLKYLLKDIRGYVKRIEAAKAGLHIQNTRAAQKGWVANYKAQGAKYLLSGEHYIARSAG